ncbi:MAG: peptide-methionine (R)-S-oxide reductase MsrB [Fimbriimonadaceae bacterium]
MRLTLLSFVAAGAMLAGAVTGPFKVHHTDAQWKKLLSHPAYRVLRKAGTEKPYSGKYWNNHAKGVYACAGCGQILFSADAKFDSGTGWPSFFKQIANGRTVTRRDHSARMERTEVLCARCGGHLGHLFDDGPKPTGLRYCLDSPALKFIPARQAAR